MKALWILTLLTNVATLVLALCGIQPLWITAAAAAAAILLILLWYVSLLPVRKAAIGIELIQAEEFNNRLMPSREPEANRIVKVFNNLMDRLSKERTCLLETNNLLELLVKASPMGVAIMDFDNRFTLVNTAFLSMAEVEEAEILGTEPVSHTSPILAALSKLSDGEDTVIRAADTEIYRVSRLSFMSKGFRRPFALIEKLTEDIRKAEKEAYGRVVRTISHEVNNTIGGLRSFLESLSEMKEVDSELREIAESCMEGSSQLMEFIRGYADVVRMGEPVVHPIDYNEVIGRELPFLRTIIPPGISLVTSLCSSSPLILVDRAMMRQVLVNIVKNASESIEATRRKDGEIRILTHADKNFWTLEIIDNGKGISAEESIFIFNPFHTTKKQGQGLGLTLTSEILHRHNFRFSLSTVAPGTTIFKITAPIFRP